jgi:FtsP/CotA-like multicopper oxidase with cupredoxin domain
MVRMFRLAIVAFVVTILLPQLAVAQSTGPCVRPGPGIVAAPAPDLYSSKGVLKLSMNYDTGMDDQNRTLFCFVTASGQEAPTLHVNPGDIIVIDLTNTVPSPTGAAAEVTSNARNVCGSATMNAASANMHFHGTNTHPACHSDEVIHTLVNSGQTFRYKLQIPPDEPPGLYWYHTHVHGIASQTVQGGATGLIEVEGIANLQPIVAGLPERFLSVRDQAETTLPVKGKTVPSWDISLNYVPVSYPNYTPAIIQMNPGTQEFWRVANSSSNTIIDLQLKYDGKIQPVKIVALDGVPTGSQDGTGQGTTLTQTDVYIPPAGRAEFVVTAPAASVKTAALSTLGIDTGLTGDTDPPRPLATIQTTSADLRLPRVAERSGRPNPQRFKGLAQATVTADRHLYFSEQNIDGPKQPGARWGNTFFFITVDGQTPTLFSPDNPPAIVTTQGSVEDWTIENRTTEVHEFHIHQIHFLLLAVNGKPVPAKAEQFYDTYQVPYWTGKGPYPSIKVRMDFRGPIVGDFVYHCHSLDHEDGGMMAIIRVKRAS